MVAHAAQDGRQGVVRPGDARGPGQVAPAHRVHVERDRLVDRAGVDAWRRDAVERVQDARRLGAVHPEGVLPVPPVAPHGAGVGAKVEPGARAGGAGVPVEPAAERRPADEVGGVAGAHRVEPGVDVLHVLEQPQVAARLEQVRGHRDRLQAPGQQVGHVEAVGAAREGERQLALELVGDRGREVRRDGVQRPARQVHRRVAGEDAPPVLDLERVRQLEPEPQAALPGDPLEAAEHGDGVGVLEVVAERRVRDRHVAEPERIVDDAPDPLGAQERRVALDRRVEAALLEQVPRDPLDLVGRAPVHRRERDRVREAVRDLDLPDGRVVAGDDVDVGRQVGRRIGHGIEVPLDVRLEDPGEVVAHAHVECDRRPLAGPAEAVVERVDQDPRPQVLVERLMDLELLRPLDVVALVLDVDAGLADVELVERLDGLELDHPGPDEPCRDDVLGHLGVGPGRDAERCVELDAVAAQPVALVGARHEEGGLRDVEQAAPGVELGEDPPAELLHRDRVEAVGHRFVPRRSGGSPVRRRAPASEAGVQAGGLLAGLRPDLVGVDARRTAVGEDGLAADLDPQRAGSRA